MSSLTAAMPLIMMLVLMCLSTTMTMIVSLYSEETGAAQRPRVAIIGAGLSGSSTAHYLRERLGDSFDIVVLEARDSIGGRVNSTDVDQMLAQELGARTAVAANQYFAELAAKMRLPIVRSSQSKPVSPNQTSIGVFDGETFRLSAGSSTSTVAKILWRYGFDYKTAVSAVTNFDKQFRLFYTLQRAGVSFASVDAMLMRMSLRDSAMISFNKLLDDLIRGGAAGSSEPVQSVFRDEFAAALIRAGYGQRGDAVNGLAGLAALMPLHPSSSIAERLWIEGGNSQLPKALLKSANCTLLLDRRVISVQRTKTTTMKPRYDLTLKDGNVYSGFDAVVIATPIEGSGLVLRLHEGGSRSNDVMPNHREMIPVFVSIVEGELRKSTFGINDSETVPGFILTSDNSTAPFWSLSLEGVAASSGLPLYKISSPKRLEHDQLNSIFYEPHERVVKEWRECASLHARQTQQSFQISKGLFYTSALEGVITAMEAAIISGRNAAMLVAKALNVTAPDVISHHQPASASQTHQKEVDEDVVVAEL